MATAILRLQNRQGLGALSQSTQRSIEACETFIRAMAVAKLLLSSGGNHP